MSIWGVSTERNFTNIIKNTPDNVGPGSYETTLTIGNKKPLKAPFGVKTNREIFQKPKFEPPPVGQYTPYESPGLVITSVFHSNSPRKLYKNSETPSPCQYNSQTQWCKTEKKKYHPKPKPAKIPLTGFVGQNVVAYTTNVDGEWVPVKPDSRSPDWVGPGSYNPRNPTAKTPTVPIGTYSTREIFKHDDFVPGPGTYTPKEKSKKLKTAISRLERKNEKNSTPFSVVPQTDWVKDKKESAEFKSKSTRGIFSTIPETPGPTTYARSVSQMVEKPAIDIAFGHRSNRVIFSINDDPGPGAYSSSEKWVKKRKPTLPKSRAGDYFTSPDTPGPGEYDIAVKEKQGARPNSSFLSKTKRVLRKIDSNPGPGTYTPQVPGESEKIPIIIKEAAKVEAWINPQQIDNPAPDAYQSIETNIRPLTIPSTTTRYTDTVSDVPGPGAYDVKHGSFVIKSHNANANIKIAD